MKSADYKSIIFEAPVGFSYNKILYDEEGHPVDYLVLEVNKAFEVLTGYPAALVVGKTFSEIVPGNKKLVKERVAFLSRIADTFGNEVYEQYSEPVGRWYQVHAFSSERGYFSAMFIDITKDKNDSEQRLKMEAVIRESEEKYRLLMENAMDGVLLTRPDGSILAANRMACSLLGMTEEEICQKGRSGIVDTSDPNLDRLLQIRKEKGYATGELVFIRKDGSKFPVEITSAKFTNSNGEEMTSLDFRDVSGRKAIEEELIRSKEKAEESDRLKTVFLANISHEIRTPVNGILGFLELLQEEDIDPEQKKTFFNVINKSAHRLLSTVNDIIEIARIESGQIEMHMGPVDVIRMMREKLVFFYPQADAKGNKLAIKEQIPAKAGKINTDKEKLDSILSNLLNNAVKFTREGRIELGNYFHDNFLVFYVRDTGIGIPASRLDAIFDRFVHADLSYSRPGEGSGLGLALARAYVERLGGQIWVESEQEKGSTFFFSIPYDPVNLGSA